MLVLGVLGPARVWLALVAAAFWGHPLPGVQATLNSVLVNSNAIKNLPPPLGGAVGHQGNPVSAAPGILYEGGNKYQPVDNYQVRRGSWGIRDAMDKFWGAAERPNAGVFQGDLLPLPGGCARVGRRWGTKIPGVSTLSRLPSSQPYPCTEDEECGMDEFCGIPTRGAVGSGAQICLACRKRRKRCMRHAMCCPGNYCKNGE